MNGRYVLASLMVLMMSQAAYAATLIPGSNHTTAFQNGVLVNYTYVNNSCTPAIYNTSEARNASGVTTCMIGAPFGANLTNALPTWTLVPSFARSSTVAGVGLNFTPAGYPIYNGAVVPTQCGAGNTSTACPGKPNFFYSPIYGIIERSIGVTGGLKGLPEGVIQNSPRDFIMSPLKNGTYTRSYIIRVSVYDPNIFPNATTGKCKAVAQSSLANATANCLTSVSALAAAINTTDSAIAVINANSLAWQAVGKPTKQAVIVVMTQNPAPTGKIVSTNVTYNISFATNVKTPNTDQTGWSFVSPLQVAPASTTVLTTTAAPTTVQRGTNSTIQSQPPQPKGNSYTLYLVVAVVIVAIGVGYYLMSKKQK